MNHLNIYIKGKVQGVFFRASAVQEAERLGITGFAKNEKDGSVYIEAEGNENALKEFLKWCASGPTRAVVYEVKTDEGAVEGFEEFGVRY